MIKVEWQKKIENKSERSGCYDPTSKNELNDNDWVLSKLALYRTHPTIITEEEDVASNEEWRSVFTHHAVDMVGSRTNINTRIQSGVVFVAAFGSLHIRKAFTNSNFRPVTSLRHISLYVDIGQCWK